MSKPIIHLEDIKSRAFRGPEKVSESCYIELEPNIKKELFRKAIELSPRKSLQSLARILNISYLKLVWSKNNPFGLNILRKISDLLLKNGYMEFSLQNLEKYIKLIKCRGNGIKILNPRLPFNFATKSGIRILSRLYHDGCISKDRRPSYSNSNKKFVEEFRKDVIEVFGNMTIKTFASSRGTKVILSRLIGDILRIVGCNSGNKVKNDPTPPGWILNLDKKLLKEFIRVAMDDDGSVGKRMIVIKLAVDITDKLPEAKKNKLLCLPERKRIQFLKKQGIVDLANTIPRILKFDKKLIESLGIKCSEPKLVRCYTDYKNKNIRVAWEIYITSRKNLKIFLNTVGFKSTHKNESLTKLVVDVKRMTMKRSNYFPFLLMVKEIQIKRGFATNNLIALGHNFSKQYIERLKLECERKGLIKEIGKEGPTIKYILTERGKIIVSKDQ